MSGQQPIRPALKQAQRPSKVRFNSNELYPAHQHAGAGQFEAGSPGSTGAATVTTYTNNNNNMNTNMGMGMTKPNQRYVNPNTNVGNGTGLVAPHPLEPVPSGDSGPSPYGYRGGVPPSEMQGDHFTQAPPRITRPGQQRSATSPAIGGVGAGVGGNTQQVAYGYQQAHAQAQAQAQGQAHLQPFVVGTNGYFYQSTYPDSSVGGGNGDLSSAMVAEATRDTMLTVGTEIVEVVSPRGSMFYEQRMTADASYPPVDEVNGRYEQTSASAAEQYARAQQLQTQQAQQAQAQAIARSAGILSPPVRGNQTIRYSPNSPPTHSNAKFHPAQRSPQQQLSLGQAQQQARGSPAKQHQGQGQGQIQGSSSIPRKMVPQEPSPQHEVYSLPPGVGYTASNPDLTAPAPSQSKLSPDPSARQYYHNNGPTPAVGGGSAAARGTKVSPRPQSEYFEPQPQPPRESPPNRFTSNYRASSDETLTEKTDYEDLGPLEVPNENRPRTPSYHEEDYPAYYAAARAQVAAGKRPSIPSEKPDAEWQPTPGEVNFKGYDMDRNNTGEIEGGAGPSRPRVRPDDDEDTHVKKGGVFSQLLALGGATMRKRNSNKSSDGTSAGAVPTLKYLGLTRVDSGTSSAGGGEDLDPEDPRITGIRPGVNRRASVGAYVFKNSKRSRRASIQVNVADILTRQTFILKLAKALMTFGAPSHRLESQLNATAQILEIEAQFIHLPTIVIASFGDIETRTSETHFIKASGGFSLGRLHKVHQIYKAVMHDEMTAGEGTRQINALLKAPPMWNLWQRMCISFVCCAVICPMGFGGSVIDAFAAGALGSLLSFMQMEVASKNQMYSNIFEISMATFISFAARGLSVTGLFCYQAVASAGVVMILPGYAVLCGSLELASKNIVAGSVRMVYAIIYSLFLGFGLTIGSDFFYLVDPPARRAATALAAAAGSTTTITGSFNPSNGTENAWMGSFTFTNGTDANLDITKGGATCHKDMTEPWYRQALSWHWLFLLVPVYCFFSCLSNAQPWRSRQFPVMVFIAVMGYVTNKFANMYIFNRSDVVSAIGAFVVGLLGNIYSRVFGGTAFTSMVPGVLFLVPSGLSAAGGIATTVSGATSSSTYSQGLQIGFRMVQVAIGVTVGLFGAGVFIYSFGKKKGSALFAF